MSNCLFTHIPRRSIFQAKIYIFFYVLLAYIMGVLALTSRFSSCNCSQRYLKSPYFERKSFFLFFIVKWATRENITDSECFGATVVFSCICLSTLLPQKSIFHPKLNISFFFGIFAAREKITYSACFGVTVVLVSIQFIMLIPHTSIFQSLMLHFLCVKLTLRKVSSASPSYSSRSK